ncbi:MAG: hypothetical protein GX766_04620 [Firmicutes bacterium]|jgi:hypothetical protein|nr:hypothetical protein [Bacillota bacterium]HOB22089.1 hypothetical protein [Bacillota bacterium]HQD39930.1 hypothetical protein [Bacillota bacterium]
MVENGDLNLKLSDEELSRKLSVGEAEYLGSRKRLDGQICDYYRLSDGEQVSYIFNVRTEQEG